MIFGGYHPTFLPDEAIQHADAVCIGEAEGNVPQMMEDFAAGALKPFYGNGLVNLVGLPRPSRALIRKQDYAPADVLQATRGCWYQCSFCLVTAFHHHHFRTRPVAEVIYQHPKVQEGIAVGLPDPYSGERIKAYIVLREGETATSEEFIDYFRRNLTGYKVPSEVEFRTELPKNMIGKILRRALREEEMSKERA